MFLAPALGWNMYWVNYLSFPQLESTNIFPSIYFQRRKSILLLTSSSPRILIQWSTCLLTGRSLLVMLPGSSSIWCGSTLYCVCEPWEGASPSSPCWVLKGGIVSFNTFSWWQLISDNSFPFHCFFQWGRLMKMPLYVLLWMRFLVLYAKVEKTFHFAALAYYFVV